MRLATFNLISDPGRDVRPQYSEPRLSFRSMPFDFICRCPTQSYEITGQASGKVSALLWRCIDPERTDFVDQGWNITGNHCGQIDQPDVEFAFACEPEQSRAVSACSGKLSIWPDQLFSL